MPEKSITSYDNVENLAEKKLTVESFNIEKKEVKIFNKGLEKAFDNFYSENKDKLNNSEIKKNFNKLCKNAIIKNTKDDYGLYEIFENIVDGVEEGKRAKVKHEIQKEVAILSINIEAVNFQEQIEARKEAVETFGEYLDLVTTDSERHILLGQEYDNKTGERGNGNFGSMNEFCKYYFHSRADEIEMNTGQPQNELGSAIDGIAKIVQVIKKLTIKRNINSAKSNHLQLCQEYPDSNILKYINSFDSKLGDNLDKNELNQLNDEFKELIKKEKKKIRKVNKENRKENRKKKKDHKKEKPNKSSETQKRENEQDKAKLTQAKKRYKEKQERAEKMKEYFKKNKNKITEEVKSKLGGKNVDNYLDEIIADKLGNGTTIKDIDSKIRELEKTDSVFSLLSKIYSENSNKEEVKLDESISNKAEQIINKAEYLVKEGKNTWGNCWGFATGVYKEAGIVARHLKPKIRGVTKCSPGSSVRAKESPGKYSNIGWSSYYSRFPKNEYNKKYKSKAKPGDHLIVRNRNLFDKLGNCHSVVLLGRNTDGTARVASFGVRGIGGGLRPEIKENYDVSNTRPKGNPIVGIRRPS